MSSLSLPPDPYKLLGVPKDAKLPAIRSAHRKLVLQCHPDKVQDAALKAIKQDEFQKVQQAYELLSDDVKRLQYDENLKLYELRKEMGRGVPTARSNPFEYEVKTAEPRSNAYDTRSTSYARPSPQVYAHEPGHRSHEDIMYEDNRHHHFKKSASYDSTTDRKRTSEKDDYRRAETLHRKREEDERAERAKEKDTKRAHSEKKKTRDKEKRRGTEDKRTRTSAPIVEDYSEDEYSPRVSEKKLHRHIVEEEFRLRKEEDMRRKEEDMLRQRMEDDRRRREDDMRRKMEMELREREREVEKARAAAAEDRRRKEATVMTEKSRNQQDFHAQYLEAAKRKAEADSYAAIPKPGLRRAETYAAPSTQEYTVRNVDRTPDFVEIDTARRSNARRTSETPATRRDRSRSRRSPSHSKESPVILDPASTPTRKPTLQTHHSAPPSNSRDSREKPSRSQTQDYLRHETIPPLPRSQTFANDGYVRERKHRGSAFKTEVISSDSEDEYRPSQRHSDSPPRRGGETRYNVGTGRAVQIPVGHRSDLHTLDENYVAHDHSDLPHTPVRPLIPRMASSETRPRTERTASYYTPTQEPAHDPYSKMVYSREPSSYSSSPQIVTATHRPPPIVRESSTRSVQYSAPLNNVKLAPHRPDPYSSPSRRDEQYYRTTGVRG